MAAQLIFTKGRLDRLLNLWMALATSSLPVPVSPMMHTEMGVLATRRMRAFMAVIRWEEPRISSSE